MLKNYVTPFIQAVPNPVNGISQLNSAYALRNFNHARVTGGPGTADDGCTGDAVRSQVRFNRVHLRALENCGTFEPAGLKSSRNDYAQRSGPAAPAIRRHCTHGRSASNYVKLRH